MYGIELLMEEHKNIIRFTKVLRKICYNILEGQEVDVEKLRECIDFARNYSDSQHHGKEEKVLFKIMMEHLGPVAEKLIRNGMLVEHDLARYHMGELEQALNRYEEEVTNEVKLDIIANAAGYANLLKRHIEKEDEVVYTFAKRMLSDEDKKKVDEETAQYEEDATKRGVQEKYISWLNQQIEE